MSLTLKPIYKKEPTDLQCGQAVIAMLSDVEVFDVVSLLKNENETTLKEMLFCLKHYGISFQNQKMQADNINQLPEIALLSLETPRCWHWSLYYKGIVYDPEHGVLDALPDCNRIYYWKINDNT